MGGLVWVTCGYPSPGCGLRVAGAGDGRCAAGREVAEVVSAAGHAGTLAGGCEMPRCGRGVVANCPSAGREKRHGAAACAAPTCGDGLMRRRPARPGRDL